MNSTSEKQYLTCAESATLLRASLKHSFPSIKFSVRSKNYAGGASIRISWTDGPTTEEVQRVSVRFEGADFDGMTDCKSYKTNLLVSESGLREVRFGSDFIFCDRDFSPGVEAAVKAEFAAKWLPSQWQAMPDYEHSRLVYSALSRYDIKSGNIEAIAREAVASYFAR